LERRMTISRSYTTTALESIALFGPVEARRRTWLSLTCSSIYPRYAREDNLVRHPSPYPVARTGYQRVKHKRCTMRTWGSIRPQKDVTSHARDGQQELKPNFQPRTSSKLRQPWGRDLSTQSPLVWFFLASQLPDIRGEVTLHEGGIISVTRRDLHWSDGCSRTTFFQYTPHSSCRIKYRIYSHAG
jgi:hypothetical protein